MADEDLLRTIKKKLADKDNPLKTSTGLEFVLSLLIDEIENDVEKEKAQKKINDMVIKMWPLHKFNVWLYAAILLTVLGLVTDNISISIGS